MSHVIDLPNMPSPSSKSAAVPHSSAVSRPKEMASSVVILFILLVLLCFSHAAQNFQEVSVCPRNADTWKLESDKKNCKGDTPDYLCAAIENNVGKYGEICTKYGLSPAGKCAVLNNQTHYLDSVDCKAASVCPAVPYNPSELWKYPICYADFYGTTRAPPTITTVQSAAPTSSGWFWNSCSQYADHASGSCCHQTSFI
ncbi:uncharacterized protein LOC133198048 [Saccostrea echinata]|uniref:uncharacterized protein LOC133198048 n=1 Tax=Saccostrea echinata TaxID=191078 RepID=UPI002A8217B3|nr:uncharacterized protein LOC133198048 [Saccostrea echinata]